MNETQDGSNSSLSAEPRALPVFTPATLLSPGDVQTAVAQQAASFPKGVQGSWYLCGDVSKEMYSLLADQTRQELSQRVFGIETPVGARYGILCQQVLGHSHRFLLPLYEPRVGDFLLAMRTGRLSFQLGHEGSEEGAMLTARTRFEPELLPLLALACPLPRELARLAIGELPMVIGEISQPNRLPMVGLEAVSEVSVSVVLPTQTLAQVLKAERN